MTTPESSSVLPSLGIDLSGLLAAPGSTDASIQSYDGGISSSGGIQTGIGVEVSLGAPAGIPQASAGVNGNFAAEGQAEAYGSYDTVDLTTDAATGTTDLSIESGDGAVSGYGGVEIGGGIGLDFSPVEGGIPEIGIEVGIEFGTYGGSDISGSYDQVEIHQQDSAGDLLE